MKKIFYLFIFIGIIVLSFWASNSALAAAFDCSKSDGNSNNNLNRCTGTPPSPQCVPLGVCTYVQCRDMAGGATARFGETWYCCNAIKSISVSTNKCNITSVGNQINLLNPPPSSVPVPTPAPAPTGGGAQSGSSAPSGGATKILDLPNPLGANATFETLLNKIINFLFWVGMAVAPVMFIVAGFLYVTSAGSPQKVESAKKMMIYAVIGLVVLLLAKGLVKVLESVIGVQNTQ